MIAIFRKTHTHTLQRQWFYFSLKRFLLFSNHDILASEQGLPWKPAGWSPRKHWGPWPSSEPALLSLCWGRRGPPTTGCHLQNWDTQQRRLRTCLGHSVLPESACCPAHLEVSCRVHLAHATDSTILWQSTLIPKSEIPSRNMKRHRSHPSPEIVVVVVQSPSCVQLFAMSKGKGGRLRSHRGLQKYNMFYFTNKRLWYQAGTHGCDNRRRVGKKGSHGKEAPGAKKARNTVLWKSWSPDCKISVHCFKSLLCLTLL